MKNNLLILTLSLLAALPATMLTKDPIKPKKLTSDEVQAMVIQNQEKILALLAQQAEITQHQNQVLAPIIEAYHHEMLLKQKREMRRIQQAKQNKAEQKQMNALSTKMPTLIPNNWTDLDAAATPMCPFVKQRLGKAGYAIATHPITRQLLILVAQQQALGLLADIAVSDMAQPYIMPIFNYLTATPEEMIKATLARKHGIDYSAIKQAEFKKAETNMVAELKNQNIEAQLLKNPEYRATVAKINELKKLDATVYFDETLKAEYLNAIQKVRTMKQNYQQKHQNYISTISDNIKSLKDREKELTQKIQNTQSEEEIATHKKNLEVVNYRIAKLTEQLNNELQAESNR